MPAKLPRVAPGARFVLSGSMWNELCDRIERCEALTVAKGGPLEMTEGGAGPVLAAKWPKRQIVRVRVTTVSPGGDTSLVLVRRYDGTTMTGEAFAVAKTADHAVDDETYVYQPGHSVIDDPEYSGSPVTWQEVGGGALPTGTGRYKVLMLVDALDPGTPGWDFPRLH